MRLFRGRQRLEEGFFLFLVLEKNSRIRFGRSGKSCYPYTPGWLSKCGVSFPLIGKWIGKCIDLYNACHPFNRSEQMFWSSIQFSFILLTQNIRGWSLLHYYTNNDMTGGMLSLYTWKWWCPMTVVLFWKRKHHWWLERSHVAMSHEH